MRVKLNDMFVTDFIVSVSVPNSNGDTWCVDNHGQRWRELNLEDMD